MLMVVAVVFAGCYDYDRYDTVRSGEPVRVELAYTFSSSAAGNQTRQAVEVVVPNTSSPRLPDNLTIIPMIDGVPQITETTWANPVEKKNTSDRTTSLYYYSQYCDFAEGVDECLVYGSVNDIPSTGGVDPKVYNGTINPSITPSSVTTQGLSSLRFDLEPIYKSSDYNETAETGKDGIPTGASTLAGYLTDVANAHDESLNLYWKNSTNIILKNLFENFTNHGYDLPGSAATVKKWLEALITAAQKYMPNQNPPVEIPAAISVDPNAPFILQAIIDAAGAKKLAIGEITDGSYPRNIKLPDGAAALRWKDVVEDNVPVKKFVPQMNTTTFDNINSMSRYAYPAALYYFVDSEIRTSKGMVSLPTEYNKVTSTDTKEAWENIIQQNFTDEYEVTSETKAVALKDPVQYAVAQLQVNLKASDSALPDAENVNVSVGSNFPLKGVIVCGQRPVSYQFVPENNLDVNVKFIYDSQVNANCTLSTTQTDAACTTLVLQSYDGEDVNIILEFENNSDKDFKGVDGTIYPGTRFYLIGKVDHSNPTAGIDQTNNGRVFTKDYITTVNMKVTSLAGAYNVLPNLLSNNLEIGVETTPEWIAAPPTTVILE